jgi:hypothetical protein
MKWLEIIKLRTAENSSGVLEKLFLPGDEFVQSGLIKIEFYRHAALESDLSIHLQWDSDEPFKKGSSLGLRFARGLKDFGLIDHSIWIEKEK